ncbi:MAG: heme exporter protein CcmB [Endozoicomonas sp. (ex Botrylloides leachii)]|nr:heme exporter protein CcmB [Endozoicomonas sp. (ex Botrylloides leachii)]
MKCFNPSLTQQSLSLFSVFNALIKREMTLSFRKSGQIINPLMFLLIVTSLFPLGITPEGYILEKIAGGLIWVTALLAVLLSLDSLFNSDYNDGTLEQLLLSPYPLPLLVLAKVLSHWFRTGLLITLISPLLGLMLHLHSHGIQALLLSLLLGTPLLSLVGAISAALTIGIHQTSVLMTLISLPFYIPILIFGTGSIRAATQDLPYQGHLLWLAVFLVLGICLAPLAIAGALKGRID